jgi:tRNA(adenine34) deaminase
MCAGAIMAARISRLVYGATDARAGAVESIFNIPGHPSLAPMPEITAGVMEDDCKALLQKFFAERR